MRTVVITGADRGVGFGLTERFLQLGWQVFAGQFMAQWPELQALRERYPDTLNIVALDVSSDESVLSAADYVRGHAAGVDMLINNAGISGGAGSIFALKGVQEGLPIFQVNVLGSLRVTRAILPLMRVEGGMKRLCFVSSEAGSISVCHRDDGFIYPMTKAALNRMVQMLFRELYPQGFTFRLYHPGWVRSYMLGKKCTAGKVEPEETALAASRQFLEDRPMEDVLLLVDYEGVTWPF